LAELLIQGLGIAQFDQCVPDHQRAFGIEVDKASIERQRLFEPALQHLLQLPCA